MSTYHSVIFDDYKTSYNTWDQWRLIPVARPVMAQPTPIYKYVDIPGRNGSLDLTDYLMGKPTYSDRKGSFEFYVVSIAGDVLTYGKQTTLDPLNIFNPKQEGMITPFPKAAAASYGEWAKRLHDISNILTGQKVKIQLEDDPDYHYVGRAFVKEWRSDPNFSRIVIDYQVEPYKYNSSGKKVGL